MNACLKNKKDIMSSEAAASTALKIKNKFDEEEDKALSELVAKYGEENWELISSKMPNRNVRQCHDRWVYYLSPNVNNEPWTEEEELQLINLVNTVGVHWVKISKLHGKRTDVQIKNRWNIIKRRMGLKISRGKVVSISKQSSKSKKIKTTEQKSATAPNDAPKETVDDVIFKDFNFDDNIFERYEDSIQQFNQSPFFNPFNPISFELL